MTFSNVEAKIGKDPTGGQYRMYGNEGTKLEFHPAMPENKLCSGVVVHPYFRYYVVSHAIAFFTSPPRRKPWFTVYRGREVKVGGGAKIC